MPSGTTRDVMTGYLQALTERRLRALFIDHVAFSIEGTDQKASGRDAVVQTIRWFHEQAFEDSRCEEPRG
jgi:hypothetical protein